MVFWLFRALKARYPMGGVCFVSLIVFPASPYLLTFIAANTSSPQSHLSFMYKITFLEPLASVVALFCIVLNRVHKAPKVCIDSATGAEGRRCGQ